jgi:hypothetical protein
MLKGFARVILTGALVASASCDGGSPSDPTPPDRNGYAGEWSGATLQGGPISFTVSPEQRVTSITITYNLNGCSDERTFSDLSLEIGTPPRPGGGPFANPGFGYASGALDQPDFVSVTGAFTSTETATGVMVFSEYFGCGNGAFVWNAGRR